MILLAYYYIDNTNGNNARTGLRIPAGAHDSVTYYTIDSTADTTHFVDSALGGYATSALVGSYFWSVTRSLGALITANTVTTGAVTLGSVITGMTAGDEYYILDSWQTINNFTTTTTRTYNDVGYIRANQTHTPGANITIDDYGTEYGDINLWGCSTTYDPWHDASSVKPIINFNGGSYQFMMIRQYWHFKNLDIRNNLGGSETPMVYIGGDVSGVTFTNCVIRDAQVSDGKGVYIGQSTTTGQSPSRVKFIDCAFTNNDYNNVHVRNGNYIIFIRCSFDSGAEGTEYGLQIYGGRIFLQDCTFGTSSAHSTADILIGSYCSARVIMRNCNTTSTPPVVMSATAPWGGVVYSEDDNATFGANVVYTKSGTVTRDTSVVRTGGASSSALMVPSNTYVDQYPLTISGDLYEPDFKVWCPASSTTITIYMRGYGTWTTVPTNTELYVEAEYVTDDTTGAITRTTAVSTQTLTQVSQSDWVAFTVTFTPHVASFANLKIYLKKYQSTSQGVYVDILPVVS